MIDLTRLIDLTVDDLLAFPDEVRYELRQGNFYVMTQQPLWHSRVTGRIVDALRGCGFEAYHRVSIKFGARDCGVADLAIVQPFVSPEDLSVVVEIVSPSSMDDDFILKPHRYARAGIPEFWRVEYSSEEDDATISKHRLVHGHTRSLGQPHSSSSKRTPSWRVNDPDPVRCQSQHEIDTSRDLDHLER